MPSPHRTGGVRGTPGTGPPEDHGVRGTPGTGPPEDHGVRGGTAASAVTGLCQLVLDVRLIALSLTMIGRTVAGSRSGWLTLTLLGGLFGSYVPLRRWHLVGPALMRHPLLLGADACFAVVVLALTGVTSPFFYFTVGTAMLAGVLYGGRGAAVFSVLLVLGYWAVVALETGALDAPASASFQTVVGLPALYPITAVAGASLRALLERQDAAAAALRQAAETAAAAEERERLAREMHDSVTKTLYGIGLSAAALPAWLERDPAVGVEQARALARAAETASREARALIASLRAGEVEEPLADAVREVASGWCRRARVGLRLDLAGAADADPAARYELVCVLREALANVERHAAASLVAVRLRALPGGVELQVADDGRGFVPRADPEGLEAAGHYGVVGMRERLRRAGGALALRSRPGRGTTVTATVRAAAPPGAAGRPTTTTTTAAATAAAAGGAG
jgi:signal transduction histidine kinase